MSKVGQEIKRLREARGWIQAKLAVEAGMAPSAVNQIENGKRSPSASSLNKLASALGVEVGDLFPKGQASLPDFEDERRARVYRFTGQQRVSVEKLREHGIEANDSEVHVLNQYIELHERPASGPVATWYVKKEDEPVDDERVKTLLAFVLWKGLLSPEQADAAGKALHAELAGNSV
jgi:transcriptional regulator with XRE-family HTH domain